MKQLSSGDTVPFGSIVILPEDAVAILFRENGGFMILDAVGMDILKKVYQSVTGVSLDDAADAVEIYQAKLAGRS